jgi:hypothetical protein
MSPEGTAHFEVPMWNDVVPSALTSIVKPADPALTCWAWSLALSTVFQGSSISVREGILLKTGFEWR